MTEVLLVRHGETLWNTEGRIQGHLDSPLSSAGVAQAEVLARRLAAERPDGLYTSDLGRALQTAEPIACATGLVPQVDPKLRERSYGRFEGRIWSEIKSEFRGDRDAHWDHTSRVKAVGGESVREFRDRVLSALDRIARKAAESKVVIVAHGGVLGMLYRQVMGIPPEAPRSYAMPNAAVNRFRFESGVWSLLVWGDQSHFDQEVHEAFADDAEPPSR